MTRRLVIATLTLLMTLPAAAQVVDSIGYTPAPQESERSYEQEYAAAERAAKRAAREQRKAEIGRGLRFEFSPTLGYSNNSHLSQRGNAYHNYAFDGSAALIVHWPLSRRFDVSAGAGFRLTHRNFNNSVCFDTASHLITGHSIDGWRDYSCWLTERSIIVPVRINIVTNQDFSIYLGATIAYQLSNSFNYERMRENNAWEPVEDLILNNIEASPTWRIELTAGMTYPLWWIVRWGWELYYCLTPTFDTSYPNTPSIHEFGIRLVL